jgi:hypothetical protein
MTREQINHVLTGEEKSLSRPVASPTATSGELNLFASSEADPANADKVPVIDPIMNKTSNAVFKIIPPGITPVTLLKSVT